MVSEIIRRFRFDIDLSNGGGRLEALWIGPDPGQAPTLVLLHEGLGCVDLWRDFPARLAAATGCGVLIYSRLGYGDSDPCALPRPLDFMHHEALTVLPAVIRQTGIRAHLLVGHSDGGSIALIHAGSKPCPGLKGVVTLAAHVFCEELTRQSILGARDRYLNGDLKARLFVYHGKNTPCAFWGWNQAWLDPGFNGWTIEACLPAIRVPVLAIQGSKDPYGSQAQIAAIQEKCGEAAVVEMIADCGHAPHLEKQVDVLSRIAAFTAGCLNTIR
ncbi:alpha/beta fold hydrolase [Desulfosarcina sp.]|uniref:alpha/beta fold hydrolase n=1 Tax=Desulfosarcina sp. TaxID=2027861 RepID=UPI003970D846